MPQNKTEDEAKESEKPTKEKIDFVKKNIALAGEVSQRAPPTAYPTSTVNLVQTAGYPVEIKISNFNMSLPDEGSPEPKACNVNSSLHKQGSSLTLSTAVTGATTSAAGLTTGGLATGGSSFETPATTDADFSFGTATLATGELPFISTTTSSVSTNTFTSHDTQSTQTQDSDWSLQTKGKCLRKSLFNHMPHTHDDNAKN